MYDYRDFKLIKPNLGSVLLRQKLKNDVQWLWLPSKKIALK